MSKNKQKFIYSRTNFQLMSPKKLNRIAALVRYKSVNDALSVLKNMHHRAAILLYKCIKSAKSNAINNNDKNAKNFFHYGQELIKKDIRINGEFYVDEMMNLLINDNLKVGIFEVEKYLCWGTPNDLKTYNYWKEFFTKDYGIQ